MARSSMYGSIASMIPKWVFGGDYGDISNDLNQRESSYEILQGQQQINDARQIQIDEARRAQALDSLLADRFGGQQPTSMRDAYKTAVTSAFELGDVGAAFDYQQKLDTLEEAARRQKLIDLKSAADLSQVFGYDRVNEAMPGVISPEEASRIYSESRRRGSGGGDGRLRASDYEVVVDTETGFKRRVPWPEAEALQQTGRYVIDPSADQQLQILSDVRKRQAAQEQATASQGPGMFERGLDAFSNWLSDRPGAQQEAQQKAIVENIKKDAVKYRTYRNKKTGEIVTLPEGQKPR